MRVAVMLLLLSGCRGQVHVEGGAGPASGESRAEAPPPEETAAEEVEVAEPPPPPRVETQTAPPSRRHVWIEGRWEWQGGTYGWVDGRWERPRRGWIWVAPKVERRGEAWIFVRGHWRRR